MGDEAQIGRDAAVKDIELIAEKPVAVEAAPAGEVKRWTAPHPVYIGTTLTPASTPFDAPADAVPGIAWDPYVEQTADADADAAEAEQVDPADTTPRRRGK